MTLVTASHRLTKSTHYDGAVHYTPRITSLTDYYPFGAGMPGRGFSEGNYRYGYQGSEKENESAGDANVYSTFYRMLDVRIGRWLSVDPVMQPWQSTYTSMDNKPILYNDQYGDSIRSYFDTQSNTLYVIDLDHYNEGLPTAELSPEMYQPGGLYDMDGNLVQNQILVIEGVFTGGFAHGEGFISYGNNEYQLPLPNGQYEILEYESSNNHHEGWYRLDARDKKPRNDRLDNLLILNSDNEMRGNFRLHISIESWGCVTFDATNENAVRGYEVLSAVLKTTTTEDVRDRLGLMNRLGVRSTMIQKYGTMTVK